VHGVSFQFSILLRLEFCLNLCGAGDAQFSTSGSHSRYGFARAQIHPVNSATISASIGIWNEGRPNGRTIGRIYLDISTGGQWFWLPD
jgi:hypothetical protein